MSRSSSGFVAGLTAAAVAVVGFLAVQASKAEPNRPGAHGPGGSAAPKISASPKPKPHHDPRALPPDTGTGERVVYALRADRVWLVGPGDKVRRTFVVMPSSVDPPLGTFAVTSRTRATLGSDGTPVEHIVRFTSVEGVTIGFSSAVDGSTPKPDPGSKTGGIRESREDGAALWEFAPNGTKVVVVL